MCVCVCVFVCMYKAAANYKHTAQAGLHNKEMYWITWLAVKREGGLQDLHGPWSLDVSLACPGFCSFGRWCHPPARSKDGCITSGPPHCATHVPKKRNFLPPWLSPENKDLSSPAVLCLSPLWNISLTDKPIPGPVPAWRNVVCWPSLGSFDQDLARAREVKLPQLTSAALSWSNWGPAPAHLATPQYRVP